MFRRNFRGGIRSPRKHPPRPRAVSSDIDANEKRGHFRFAEIQGILSGQGHG